DEDVQKMQAIFNENPEFLKAVYGALTGIEGRAVKGVKVALVTGNGKRSIGSNHELGDAEMNPVPIGGEVAPEVMQKIKVNDKAKLGVEGIVRKNVIGLANGELKQGDLKTKII